jgi:cytochrome c oxidase subunit 2
MKFRFVPDNVSVRKGQTLKLELTSADVEHSFRLSTLGLNYPVVPGKTTEVVLTPAFTEELHADCGKFCGAGHKKMNFTIDVEP